MAEDNDKKVVPLRVSQLLPEILAMQDEEEDYGSESEGEYPDRSFSDGEIIDHNKGFYKASYKTSEITHPICSKPKEQNIDNWVEENVYNQTYPNKESQSASKNKSKILSTPLRTPNKHNTVSKQVTASGRLLKVGTTPSSNSKRTPRYMKGLISSSKNSGKKTTPFRKCLNQDEAFKSTTKAKLFCWSKGHPTPDADNVKYKSERKARPASLDELFASSLQIDEPRTQGCPQNISKDVGEKASNPFGNKIKNFQNAFATPKTSVTTNCIIKGCRDNLVTPLKPADISGVYKHETPCTQNNSLFRNQQTPLFTIKEKSDDSRQHSVKRFPSHTKHKEGQVLNDHYFNHKKSLFKESNDARDKLPALKESQNKDIMVPSNKQSTSLKEQNTKLIAESHFKHQGKVSDDALVFDRKPQDTLPAEGGQGGNKENVRINHVGVSHPSINKHNSFGAAKESHHHFVSNKPDRIFELYHEIEHDKQINNRFLVDNKQLWEEMHSGQVPGGDYNVRKQESRFAANQSNRMGVENPLHIPHQMSETNSCNNRSSDENNLKADSNHPFSLERLRAQPCDVQQQLSGTARQFKMLTVKGKQYIVLGNLGSGGSSEVYKVMDPENSAMYAVKCVNLAVEQSIAQSYINEIKLLQRLQGSDRVITMHDYEYLEKKRTLYVVLEMGDVDLSKLMKGYRSRESKLPLPILVCYWTEMLTAVRHIHQNGIIHSDLKPANFLLVHGRLKLIDFGIASSLNADATSVLKDSTTGTFNYISPEAVNAGNEGRDPIKISYKSDVWSLGCILYSMLYGRTPFSHVTHIMAKIRALCNPDQIIEYPEIPGVPTVLMNALRWCLTYDIKNRPTVQQLIELPYIGDSLGQIHLPLSDANKKKVPLSIMLKIKAALTSEELGCVIDVLEGK